VEPARENAVVMLINRFFCPARSHGTNVDGYGAPVHCQSICWDVLSTVPEVVAVLCSLPDMRIMEASTKACKMWGSSKLHGELLLSLVNSPPRGAALQKSLNDVPASAAIPGFCIKDLQCMEMKTKHGGGLDASITIVRLPPEPKLNISTFDEAVAFFNDASTGKAWKGKASNEDQLVIYALFKQQKDGDCTGARPGMFSPTDRAKWDGWDSKKGMSAEDAQKAYVEAANAQKAKYGL